MREEAERIRMEEMRAAEEARAEAEEARRRADAARRLADQQTAPQETPNRPQNPMDVSTTGSSRTRLSKCPASHSNCTHARHDDLSRRTDVNIALGGCKCYRWLFH